MTGWRLVKTTLRWAPAYRLVWRPMSSGEWGSGAGRGGGSGGSIRDAGGAFGKMEAAHEEEYFRRLNAIQMKELKEHHEDVIDEYEKQILEHKQAIERHKRKIEELAQLEDRESKH